MTASLLLDRSSTTGVFPASSADAQGIGFASFNQIRFAAVRDVRCQPWIQADHEHLTSPPASGPLQSFTCRLPRDHPDANPFQNLYDDLINSHQETPHATQKLDRSGRHLGRRLALFGRHRFRAGKSMTG